MKCTACSKLLFKVTTKKCIKCTAQVLDTLSVLCETCSNNNKMCAVCLKKVQNSVTNKFKFGGCKVCGK